VRWISGNAHFQRSELETLKAEIGAVSIQLFSTRSAVDGGEKLIRVYHGDGYINIRQETIEQPQWRQLDDSLDRILKRFWPPPANPALREEARITPLAAQETRSADRGSQ
jgi:hypothetical protein